MGGRARSVDLAVAAVVAVVTLAVYWPAGSFGWINFDDGQYVSGNAHVLGGLTAGDAAWAFSRGTFAYWHPLTWLSLQADVTLWGPRPGPMHLENVAWHAAAAAGWYLLWAGLTGRRGPAAVVALLFAVHPTRVESVAWVAERKDVLCGAMTVATLLAYAAYARGRQPRGWYAAAVVAYALAVMAKPMAVTVPALMLVLDFWPVGRAGRTVRRLAVDKVPFAAMAVVAAGLTLASTSQAAATPTLAQLGVRDRLATAAVGYVRYLGKLAVPRRLSVFYPYQVDQPLAVVVAAVGLLAVVTWTAWRVRRRAPYVAVGWAWFVVALVPVIGLVQSGEQSMADRFAYTAAVGPFVAVVWLAADGVDALARRGGRGGRAVRLVAAGVAVAGVGACAVGAATYLAAWRDAVSVWTWAADALGRPVGLVESHLGGAYLADGRPDLALDHYAAAAELTPDDPYTQGPLGRLLLGVDPAQAEPHLRRALRARPDDPVLWVALGRALAATHDRAGASAAFRRALASRPDDAAARAGLASVAREPGP